MNLVNTAKRYIAKNDPVMARLIKQCGPISLGTSKSPHFHALIRTIINQQLSIKAGQTIEKRVLLKQEGRYFSAEKLHKLSTAELRSCGMSQNKIRYAQSLTQAVLDGELNFRKLVKYDDEHIRKTLTLYPGIGPWSADMFLITSLSRPDVFPLDDLVLRKSMQKHYRLSDNTNREAYFSLAEVWRPYRTVASKYLWHSSD